LTFLFDAVYGLGFFKMLWFMFEKFFGFGKKKVEIKVNDDGTKEVIEIKKFMVANND